MRPAVTMAPKRARGGGRADRRSEPDSASIAKGDPALEDPAHDAVAALESHGDLADRPALLVQARGVFCHDRFLAGVAE
jgi:hypothetical protein